MTYATIGLDSQLRAKGGIAGRIREFVDSSTFGANYEVNSGVASFSKINVEELIRVSSVGTAVGDFESSSGLNLTSTLTYTSPHESKRIFGIAYLSVYEGAGTAAANQIWPKKGANVTAGRYEVTGFYNFAEWDHVLGKWGGIIYDTNGTSSQEITLATQWWYVDNKHSKST